MRVHANSGDRAASIRQYRLLEEGFSRSSTPNPASRAVICSMTSAAVSSGLLCQPSRHGGRAGERFVNGGRVLNVVGMGTTIDAARDRACETAEKIKWPGMEFRRDIAG